MGNKQNIFQIALLILFGIFAVVGVIIIATNKNDSQNMKIKIPITIWGSSSDTAAVKKIINELEKENETFKNVSYVGKNINTIYGDLLEAIATGNSPDIVLLNSSGLLPLKNKIYPISFETLPLHSFRETYVEGSEIFVLSDAVYALPVLVDPLVLYWNRDLFTNAGIAQVPKNWDEFVQLVPRLSNIVNGAELKQSAIAFGEYDNVLHAKEIISALFMQTGASIVAERRSGFVSDFGIEQGSVSKSELALKFYTSFSNPIKTVYSWNKTFDRSREEFAANKVAMYVGFVSEEPVLKEINPNLNFDMTIFPQSVSSNRNVTYGKFKALAVLKASKNPQTALYVARFFSSAGISQKLSEYTGLPSARRDVLTKEDVSDPFSITKTQSAIMSHSWLEPSPKSKVNDIFSRTINGIVAGNITTTEGILLLTNDLNALLERYDDKDKN